MAEESDAGGPSASGEDDTEAADADGSEDQEPTAAGPPADSSVDAPDSDADASNADADASDSGTDASDSDASDSDASDSDADASNADALDPADGAPRQGEPRDPREADSPSGSDPESPAESASDGPVDAASDAPSEAGPDEPTAGRADGRDGAASGSRNAGASGSPPGAASDPSSGSETDPPADAPENVPADAPANAPDGPGSGDDGAPEGADSSPSGADGEDAGDQATGEGEPTGPDDVPDGDPQQAASTDDDADDPVPENADGVEEAPTPGDLAAMPDPASEETDRSPVEAEAATESSAGEPEAATEEDDASAGEGVSAGEAATEAGGAAENPVDVEAYREDYGLAEDVPEGPPDDQEMPLTEHIEEMILRLAIVSAVAAVVASVVFFLEPVAEDTIMHIWNAVLPIEQYEGAAARPRVYGPLELKLTELKFASLAGFVLALPVFVYQTYRFMRPGLYPHERRYYLAAVPTSLVLAFVGVTFSYYVVLPGLFLYFFRYSDRAGTLAFALRQTFDLILVLMGYMALVFQIPLFIMLAIMMGLADREWMEDKRLLFWGAFLGVSFLFIPEPTGMAPIVVAVTMVALFEGTLALLRWTGH